MSHTADRRLAARMGTLARENPPENAISNHGANLDGKFMIANQEIV